MAIRRVTDPAEALYRHGRTDGSDKPLMTGEPRTSIPTPKWELDPKGNSGAVQDRNSGHGPGYDNDAPKDWKLGYGLPPHFDRGGSGRRHGRR
jgi:hypothetical protein